VEGNDEKYSCRCWYDFRRGRAWPRHCICVQYGYEPTRNPPSVETTLTPDHAKGVITQSRLRAVKQLSGAGVPVGILVAPIIPALTDHEMERIMEAAVDVGARWAGYVMLRLPYEVKDLFREWLAEHHPQSPVLR
jgi:DNA repair photolyase